MSSVVDQTVLSSDILLIGERFEISIKQSEESFRFIVSTNRIRQQKLKLL